MAFNKSKLGKRIKKARERVGMSQAQAAEALGMHRPTISEIEAGRRNVKDDEINAFADLYSTDSSWLMYGEKGNMSSNLNQLSVKDIDFDLENPRIKKALEKYGDKITAERINFALRSASGDSGGSSTFARLRDSIVTNGGITQPITVISNKGKYVCIDGNTRLAIYKEFLDKEDSRWQMIPALLIDSATQKDIETIRVSAHLVGPRSWPAYEKARYLHYLYYQELMSTSEMVSLCGGNKKEIDKKIAAYEDMNKHYRDRVDDTAFHIDRYSGFEELQNTGIKDAIFDAGCSLDQFGDWIKEGKIKALRGVRDLPKVLRDDEAREMFLTGGIDSIKHAVKALESRAFQERGEESVTLDNVSVQLLSQALLKKIESMSFSEIQQVQNDIESGNDNVSNSLENLTDKISEFLSYVRK